MLKIKLAKRSVDTWILKVKVTKDVRSDMRSFNAGHNIIFWVIQLIYCGNLLDNYEVILCEPDQHDSVFMLDWDDHIVTCLIDCVLSQIFEIEEVQSKLSRALVDSHTIFTCKIQIT